MTVTRKHQEWQKIAAADAVSRQGTYTVCVCAPRSLLLLLGLLLTSILLLSDLLIVTLRQALYELLILF